MTDLNLPAFAKRMLVVIFFAGLVALACTSEDGNSSSVETTPQWQTVAHATLGPTVIPEPLVDREAYCRAHALPTPTPAASETPTPVPTSPPSTSDDELPIEWIAKMNEIEEWAREFYEIDESAVGEFSRSVVDEKVWREWLQDAVNNWLDDGDSNLHLWEQINRTLTLLSADSRYAEFLGEYSGDRSIGLYDPTTRQIFLRGNVGEFDLGAELIYLHEYSHHLQNAKYELAFWSDCFKGDGDARGAIAALIEGDASNTEYEYIESVIGWDRLEDYYENLENDGGDALNEPVMARLRDEINSFTYGTGAFFVLKASLLSECLWCETNRQRVDELFKRPPYTTEQIYYEQKYFDEEGADRLILSDDVLGEGWELRSGTTIGRSDWIALLATLTNADSDEIEPDFPGWRGDYGMLFEDEEGRALYLQVAVWENNRYIDGLIDAFDDQHRLTSYATDQRTRGKPFEDLRFWESDTGNIAMGIELEPVDRFYTMFLAVGPDGDTVKAAIHAAREGLTNEGVAGDSDTGWVD